MTYFSTPTVDGGFLRDIDYSLIVNDLSSTVLSPVASGGDDAAAFTAALPAAGGAGKTIRLVPGATYNWATTPQLPAGLTSWLTIDPNGAVIKLASGVRRFFDLNGAAAGSDYSYIRFMPGGTWDFNGNTAGAVNNHVLLGNLIAGSATGTYSFNHIHVRGQTCTGAPMQATPSLQWVRLHANKTSGVSDDIVIEDCTFSGGNMGWAFTLGAAGQKFGVIRTNHNRFDSGTVPTTLTGSAGNQVGGAHGYVEFYEARGNRIANSWDVGIEADQCLKAVIADNEFVDNYNCHVLVRNMDTLPNTLAQQVIVENNLFRNASYDPSGTNGLSNHILVGTSTATSFGTGDVTSGSRSIANASSAWAVGQTIIGTGIPVGAVVNKVSGSTLTISLNATASNTGVSLSYQDFQLGEVVCRDNESSFESAVTDTGARTGIVIDTKYANIKSLVVDGHKVGFGSAFAYTPTPGSHLVLFDLSPFDLSSVIKARRIHVAYAGAPATAANFIEAVRVNPVNAEIDIDGVTVDVSALDANVGSLNLMGITLGYQSTVAPYKTTAPKVHGVIRNVVAYNGQISVGALYGIYGDGNLSIPSGTFINMYDCDFSQWSSSSGADYTSPAAGSPFAVRTYAGSRTGASSGGVPLTIASATTTTLPRGGDWFTISGTTAITSVTASYPGRRVTLMFSGALTFTDGSNLKLAGNFATAADGVITLVCDGTNWWETGRSAN